VQNTKDACTELLNAIIDGCDRHDRASLKVLLGDTSEVEVEAVAKFDSESADTGVAKHVAARLWCELLPMQGRASMAFLVLFEHVPRLEDMSELRKKWSVDVITLLAHSDKPLPGCTEAEMKVARNLLAFYSLLVLQSRESPLSADPVEPSRLGQLAWDAVCSAQELLNSVPGGKEHINDIDKVAVNAELGSFFDKCAKDWSGAFRHADLEKLTEGRTSRDARKRAKEMLHRRGKLVNMCALVDSALKGVLALLPNGEQPTESAAARERLTALVVVSDDEKTSDLHADDVRGDTEQSPTSKHKTHCAVLVTGGGNGSVLNEIKKTIPSECDSESKVELIEIALASDRLFRVMPGKPTGDQWWTKHVAEK
jgi:hypothetical protein